MPFTPPPGSNKEPKPQSYRHNSFDLLDTQFEDSLDAALESLQLNTTGSVNGEDIEMKSIRGIDELNSHARLNSDTEPLMNAGQNLPGSWSRSPHNRHRATNGSSFWSRLSGLVRSTNESNSPKYTNSPIELKDQQLEREIHPGTTPIYDRNKYVPNAISNAKYNPVTFIPIILYEQFKFFFNLYFLVVALSQAIPQLRIGYLSSYIVPLAFVLTVTMSKEALDDIQRRRRDNESNNEMYEVLSKSQLVPSKDLKVGDLIKIGKGARAPADLVLLQSSEPSGEIFIKTDQLDGETDWKLRIACPLTQHLSQDDLLNKINLTASVPETSIANFLGKLTYNNSQSQPLSVDNTMWANTVFASAGTSIACVVYTGTDTRQAMNTTTSSVKTGLLELEINSLSKILCVCVFVLSVTLVAFSGFDNKDWYVDIMRYLILFSTIIPVSLRVNLDLGKSVYAHQIEHDKTIPDTIVRTSTIPEDLGRIEYLLTDKTGTLTQNDMELKKLQLDTVSYTLETMDIVTDYVSALPDQSDLSVLPSAAKRDMSTRVRDLVSALAICHQVTPTFEDGELTYQAASPDEIAIVKFSESVGLTLFKRDRHSMTLLHDKSGTYLEYDILKVFPFNSDNKRMGIIIFDKQKQEYWFLQKGADVVMIKIVQSNDWLEEETGNLAREGLRTLVVGRKKLSKKAYESFEKEYKDASLMMLNREVSMNNAVSKHLEHDLEILGVTGVEDKLQDDVKSSIELLRNAGIKIWMLTGDKVETARCVSISAKLVSRGQYVHTVTKVNRIEGALGQLELLKVNQNSCLLIDGESLGFYLDNFRQEFFDIVVHLPAVIACRCTPQQKADVATFIREVTGRRVCCIGDGGNDVSMIRSADVGVGIVGKEGKQASLAADFSITQFSHLSTLLLWHGRNSYKRSAKLAQFVIHRGLLISVCQAVYSISSEFEPIALYQGWLMVGYATCYTMAPVFSLTLDRDIDQSLTKTYPELYKELTAGVSLSYKTFFVWVALSLFQGCIIQGFSQGLTSLNELDFKRLVALSFTALILNELIMVAIEIYTWNKTMVISEVLTFFIFVASVPFLNEYFDLSEMVQPWFYGKVALILGMSILPVWAAKALHRKLNPPSYAKVQQFYFSA
ncbi:LANO_0B03796g1_1 [Lachancea nothofagi CBS 11611]|uniref:Phospholipid-transporting ATPase n=1 Tax=Lachancea nothofagi CBS 11611 TaxID=1266666 RepID=A0A1G4IX69_9SACH|nr:LANO_0B03796g1_1 [Lachancea nothofagi CBS 11611]